MGELKEKQGGLVSRLKDWWSKLSPARKKQLSIVISGLVTVAIIIIRPKTAPLFMKDQFIVVGPKDNVKSIVSDVQSKFSDEIKLPITLERRYRRKLWYLQGLWDMCEGLSKYKSANSASSDEWVMDLYEIESGDSNFLQKLWGKVRELFIEGPRTARVVARINLSGNSSSVYADLVYGTASIFGGLPWTGMGSPWIDNPVQYAGTQIEPQEAYLNQWAFVESNNGGIELFVDGKRSVEYWGEDVWIGVFDTSPFHSSQDVPKDWDWLTPITMPTLLTEYPFSKSSSFIKDHGLSVASLAHTVAPSSTVHLYQVLNGNAVGDLFTFNDALHSFISGTVEVSHTLHLNGAVINLSLGSPIPTPKLLQQIEDYLEKYDLVPKEPKGNTVEALAFLPKEPTSLDVLLSAARCRGIVTVAAAGNTAHLLPSKFVVQAPATFTSTLGVAASNHERGKACFSNAGDVMAPSGDGRQPCCRKPRFKGCEYGQADDCWKYGLIGCITESKEHPTGYTYLVGTSFSTPLVSGLAALVLEAESGWQSSEWKSLDGGLADHVIETIIGAAECSRGVINVPKTLAGASCLTPTPAPTPTPTPTS